MRAALGVIFYFLGDFASGRSYVTFKWVKKRVRESWRPIVGLLSWLIVPRPAAPLTIPGSPEIVKEAEFTIFGRTCAMGGAWGIGRHILFRFWKMSLGCAVVWCYCDAFGSFNPPFSKFLKEAAMALGFNPHFQNNVNAAILRYGGLTPNFAWSFGCIPGTKIFPDDNHPRFRNPGGIWKFTYY